jgi:hypothetical protein
MSSVIDNVYFDLMYGEEEVFFARFNNLNDVKKVAWVIDAPADDWYVIEYENGKVVDYISTVQL